MEKPEEKEPKKMRQIVIETDGDIVNLAKAEVAGKIELVGILETLIKYVRSQP